MRKSERLFGRRLKGVDGGCARNTQLERQLPEARAVRAGFGRRLKGVDGGWARNTQLERQLELSDVNP